MSRRCKHYTKQINRTCAAGVEYESFAAEGVALFRRLPCYNPNAPTTCAKFELDTEHEAEIQAMLATLDKLSPLIRTIKTRDKGKQTAGVDTCPVCGKPLRWWHAAYNGHIGMQCETPSCVAMQE